MNKKILIKELKNLFIKVNKLEKKYSSVWLSEIDFGGLYYSDKFILNVKTEYHNEVITAEIRKLSALLRENLNVDIYSQIESVTVYNDNDRIWHERGDIILLEEAYLDAA